MKYTTQIQPDTFFTYKGKLWQAGDNDCAQEVRDDGVDSEWIDLPELDEVVIRAGKFDAPGGVSIHTDRQGRLHRAWGKPAIDSPNWKQYCKNGMIHRDEGPAIEYPNGEKQWWVNDRPHRTDGPAMIYSDGTETWWRDGKQITDELTILVLKQELKLNNTDE